MQTSILLSAMDPGGLPYRRSLLNRVVQVWRGKVSGLARLLSITPFLWHVEEKLQLITLPHQPYLLTSCPPWPSGIGGSGWRSGGEVLVAHEGLRCFLQTWCKGLFASGLAQYSIFAVIREHGNICKKQSKRPQTSLSYSSKHFYMLFPLPCLQVSSNIYLQSIYVLIYMLGLISHRSSYCPAQGKTQENMRLCLKYKHVSHPQSGKQSDMKLFCSVLHSQMEKSFLVKQTHCTSTVTGSKLYYQFPNEKTCSQENRNAQSHALVQDSNKFDIEDFGDL